MDIYFGCSLGGEKGGDEDKALVIEMLKKLGHTVLSEIFYNYELQKKDLTPEQIYQRDIAWVEKAEVMVADVSRASLGLGYELGWLLAHKRRVVAICKKDRFENLSNMIKGCNEPTFSLHQWENEADLVKIFEKEL